MRLESMDRWFFCFAWKKTRSVVSFSPLVFSMKLDSTWQKKILVEPRFRFYFALNWTSVEPNMSISNCKTLDEFLNECSRSTHRLSCYSPLPSHAVQVCRKTEFGRFCFDQWRQSNDEFPLFYWRSHVSNWRKQRRQKLLVVFLSFF